MGRKVYSQPLRTAKIREGGHSVTQTKHMGVMHTQVPRVRPQGTWIPPLLACKLSLSLRRVAQTADATLTLGCLLNSEFALIFSV